jgi:hypothetical protein
MPGGHGVAIAAQVIMVNSLLRRARPAAIVLLAAGSLFFGLLPLQAQVKLPEGSGGCIPKGDTDPTYLWNRLHIVRQGDGREAPTPKSLASQKKNQTGQIVLDPVRNLRVAFISGVTLEAPAGTEGWSVVQTRTCPPARWAGAMAYDPLNDEIVLWGGTMSIEGPTNDTWIYDTTKRDWRVLEDSSPLRDLRAAVGALRDELETVRWDSWKTLEWQVTGKQGALPPPALAARLDSLDKDLAAAGALAAAADSALTGYEKSQAAGAKTWLDSAAGKLTSLGSGFQADTPDGLEGGYRALLSLRADVLSAVDSLLSAPRSRYFVSLTYDAAQQALVLGSSIGAELRDDWVYRLADRRWERLSPKPGTAVSVEPPEGEFVLRDAATVADLREWQAKTSAWAADLPPNTWVVAPANGTGRPNWGRAWSSIVYDPDREQLYYRDGGHGNYHGNITDHYDIRTGRWFRSDVEQVPDGRIMGTYFGWGRGYNYAPWAIHTYKWNLFYNPLTKHLQRRVFHTPNYPVDGNVNDYDPDQGKWSKQPLTVNLVGLVIPGTTEGVLSVKGWERYSALSSAIVGYETASGFKQWQHAGGIPFPGANHDDHFAFVFDPHRQRAMYYGGEGDKLGLYVLDVQAAKPRWTRLEISVEGAKALPRSYREWIYIPRHDVFLTMKWQNGGSSAPAVWSFDPTTNVFRPVELALGPGVKPGAGAGNLRSPSVSAGLAYDPVSDVAFYIHAALGPPTMFAFRYVPPGGG